MKGEKAASGAGAKKTAKRSQAEVEEDLALALKFKTCRLEAARLGNNRKHFLIDNRDLIEPFCPLPSLNRLSAQPKSQQLRPTSLRNTPAYIKAKLRDYQLHGINEMLAWYGRGVGGILADEMGLGKTLQTISFLATLKHKLGVSGPHLVIAPLAVLQNWANEFDRFCPSLCYKKIYGSIKEREAVLSQDGVQRGSFDVYLTTYETVIVEEAFFSDSWHWATVTIDEGHRIKNEHAVLRAALNRVRSPFRLLLTGTPLQNSLHELWALLNYILPEVFSDSAIFDEGAAVADDNLNMSTVKKARALLDTSMMVRRMKKDVESGLRSKLQCKIYVPMTPLQTDWYRSILEKDYGKLELMSSQRLKSLLSQLFKIVNHPKQIYNRMIMDRDVERKRVATNHYQGCEFFKEKAHLYEPDIGSVAWTREQELACLTGEALVQASGKLAMLDRLLIRLKRQGSRVLLFSQYTETLDVLEEYATFRFGELGRAYLRLDGETNLMLREIGVRSFNAPGSQIFLYLISTRAGGVGLNLATADSVVLFDSSWNPQVDLQAQDRAHRIGQKKQVTVFRLITKDSMEERINQIAERKMILDQALIAKNIDIDIDGLQNEDGEAPDLGTVAMTSLLSFGASKIMNCSSNAESGIVKSAEELDLEIDLFIKKALSSSDASNGNENDNFEAVHRQPVGSLVTARRSADDDAFAPCVIIDHADSTVQVCWVDSNEDEWLRRDAALFAELGAADTESLKEMVERRLQEEFQVHETKPGRGRKAKEEQKAKEDEAKPGRRGRQKGWKKAPQAAGDEGGGDPSSPPPAPLVEATTGYRCAQHAHALKPTSSDVGVTSCGVCTKKGASRFSCIRGECRWHICASCSDAEPALADKYLSLDHVDFAMVGGPAAAGIVKLAHPDGTYDIEYMDDGENVLLATNVDASCIHPSGGDGKRSRHRKAPRRYEPVLPEKKASRKRDSESECFLCYDGGDLLECGLCPKVYHLECVGLSKVPTGTWSCPWHACTDCGRKSSMTGGMQFRCLTCPEAYCFDCFPKDQEMKGIEPPRGFVRSYELYGFDMPKKVVWRLCHRCGEVDRLRREAMERERAQMLGGAQRKAEEVRARQDQLWGAGFAARCEEQAIRYQQQCQRDFFFQQMQQQQLKQQQLKQQLQQHLPQGSPVVAPSLRESFIIAQNEEFERQLQSIQTQQQQKQEQPNYSQQQQQQQQQHQLQQQQQHQLQQQQQHQLQQQSLLQKSAVKIVPVREVPKRAAVPPPQEPFRVLSRPPTQLLVPVPPRPGSSTLTAISLADSDEE